MLGLTQVPPFLQPLLQTAIRVTPRKKKKINREKSLWILELEFSSQLIETLQTSMGVFVCMGPSGTAGVFLLRGGLVLDHRSVNRVVLHPVVSSMMSQNVRHVFTVTRQFKKKK